jgi:hypothetical protein
MSEMKIGEHPPSTLRNVDDWPLRGARAEDPRNIDDRPPECPRALDQVAPTINAKKHRWWAPGRCGAEDLGAPTINAKKH